MRKDACSLMLAVSLAACSGANSEPDQPDSVGPRGPSGPGGPSEPDEPPQTSQGSPEEAESAAPGPTARQVVGEPAEVELDGDCIAADPTNTKSGPGPSIAKHADLDLDALEALLPVDPRDPQLEHTETNQWRRGDAGHGSPFVVRHMALEGGATASIQIMDFIHICTCATGMGERMVERAKAAGSATEKMGGQTVVVDDAGKSIGAWAGDRCQVSIRTDGKKQSRALAEGIDWKALAEACSAREPKNGLLGVD